MATSGPRYPGTVATEVGPSGDNDWLTTGNISADDAAEAQITAATYDAADHSFRLKATNFGFDADVPAASTIDGITVEIDRRCFAGAAQDQEVRLYDSTATLVGDDKQTATAWPATLGIATYGGAADTWTASLDSADILSTSFGVALIVLADGANTDIGVDFIRVTVNYTPTAQTVSPGLISRLLAATAPQVGQDQIVSPALISRLLAATGPRLDLSVSPALISRLLIATAFARLDQTLSPALISRLLVATAPQQLGLAVNPALLSRLLIATAPTITVDGGGGDQSVSPPLLSAALAVVALSRIDQELGPGTLSRLLVATAPTVTVPLAVSPPALSMALAILTPIIGVLFPPDATALIIKAAIALAVMEALPPTAGMVKSEPPTAEVELE